MRAAEAQWVGQVLASEPVSSLSPLLDLGSSTPDFKEERSHIARYIFEPLAARGVKVISVDLKDAPGVDIVGDIFETATQQRISALDPKVLLCCNILEHVPDPAAFANAVSALLPAGGLLIVTVPKYYPLHLDPIDTYYRPSPASVQSLFPEFQEVRSAVIEDTNFASDLAEQGKSVIGEAAKAIAKSALLKGGYLQSKARLHRLLWLWRKYEVTAVALRKR